MACTYEITSRDTGRRRKNQDQAPRVVWDHTWTATCGASKSGYEVKGKCVADAIAHCNRCTR